MNFVESCSTCMFLQTKFGVDLYEDVACMVYDLLDAKRQWRTYLENLNLLQVPTQADLTAAAAAAQGTEIPAEITKNIN